MAARSPAVTGFALRMGLVLWASLVAVPARADGRLQFLAERLKYPPLAGQQDDFRVRTNAALALGASNDEDAVPPLCGGLSDPSEVVRQAAAVALKRLGRASSLDCLSKRLALETNPRVKQQLQRSIDAVEGMGPPTPALSAPATAAPFVFDARYYVSISPVANNTGRPNGDIDRAVHDAIASKLAEVGGYQVAPRGESAEVARDIMSKRKLKGFYLAVSVEKFDYSEGSLRVRVRIAVFSYPGKDLRGEVPAGAKLAGTHPGDTGSEYQLVGLVATRAAELFAQNFR